ncbi:esterase [Silvimonas iriomotensis]|uniref:Esterase n=1 Tax=Silvimonas iriomotensis TaxID=449662 RepID=A0ABQ2PAU8_9NEIS|nr:esterase [Silvimonas iriomotensis]GGP22654.1 esterase [Silvimonas iriomotensis]
MQDALIIQQPADVAASDRELWLFFHGVGSRAEDLVPLGEALAPLLPKAWIVSVRSPDPSDFGQGWQWFSVQGVTEASRPVRIAGAMPRFVEVVRHWQQQTGVHPVATTLAGFSQGAIMALESTSQPQALAKRVISLAGRFATLPTVAPQETAIHFLHGQNDQVINPQFAVDAWRQLQVLGAHVSCDLFPNLGHGLDGRVVQRIAQLIATDQGEAATTVNKN